MDYKKIIIINLAFMIILGKLLLSIFNRMQRNLNRIDIDSNKLLKFIFNYNYTGIFEESQKENFTLEDLKKFNNELNEFLKKYEFLSEVTNELEEVIIINQIYLSFNLIR